VVKYVMVDAVSAAAEPAEDGSTPDGALSPESGDYRLEVISAVTRITGRRVQGFIPKRDAKTDVATETFILEPTRARQ
jgi:hypothetical protein